MIIYIQIYNFSFFLTPHIICYQVLFILLLYSSQIHSSLFTCTITILIRALIISYSDQSTCLPDSNPVPSNPIARLAPIFLNCNSHHNTSSHLPHCPSGTLEPKDKGPNSVAGQAGPFMTRPTQLHPPHQLHQELLPALRRDRALSFSCSFKHAAPSAGKARPSFFNESLPTQLTNPFSQEAFADLLRAKCLILSQNTLILLHCKSCLSTSTRLESPGVWGIMSLTLHVSRIQSIWNPIPSQDVNEEKE